MSINTHFLIHCLKKRGGVVSPVMNFANVVISIVGLQGCRGNGEVTRGLKYDVRVLGSVNLEVKKDKQYTCQRMSQDLSPCNDYILHLHGQVPTILLPLGKR